jgi:hypothetical protein
MGHAAIGKVRLKNGAAVLPIRKGHAVDSSRRDDFAREVILRFGEYVEQFGSEPEAVVFVLGGVTQPIEVYYVTEGETDGKENAILAMASVALHREGR